MSVKAFLIITTVCASTTALGGFLVPTGYAIWGSVAGAALGGVLADVLRRRWK